MAESGVTMHSDSEQYSPEDLSTSPPSSSSPPIILYQPPTLWSVVRGAAINLFLPFVNGMMLGFGELFAHEAAFRLGWSGTRVCSPFSSSSTFVMVLVRSGSLLKSCLVYRCSLYQGGKGILSVQALRPVTSRETPCPVWMTSRAWSNQLRLYNYHKARGSVKRSPGTGPKEQSQYGNCALRRAEVKEHRQTHPRH